jgi:hypothetical protein
VSLVVRSAFFYVFAFLFQLLRSDPIIASRVIRSFVVVKTHRAYRRHRCQQIATCSIAFGVASDNCIDYCEGGYAKPAAFMSADPASDWNASSGKAPSGAFARRATCFVISAFLRAFTFCLVNALVPFAFICTRTLFRLLILLSFFSLPFSLLSKQRINSRTRSSARNAECCRRGCRIPRGAFFAS